MQKVIRAVSKIAELDYASNNSSVLFPIKNDKDHERIPLLLLSKFRP